MKRVKLPEICTIPITDGTHQTPTYTTKEDGIPFISSKDVTTKKIDWTNIKYITKDLHEQLYKRIAPQKNDILLAKNGTTGVAALVEDNRVFDIYVTLAVIRPDLEKVFPKYLLHVINSDYCKKQFSSHLVGIGVPNLHLKDINQTSIPLPSLPEQQKIAAHLDSIQSAIDNKKQQLQQLDELVKSKFVEMFGENPVESGKWKVEKLSSICKVQTGGTPSRMHPEYFEGNIPWITTANLGVNELNYDDAMEYITQEAVDNSATKIIPAHSLFIGIRVGVGKCSINNVDMCSNQDICGLSGFDVARTNLLFVKKVIDSYEDYFDNAKRGTTIKGVKSDTIKELKIFLPEIELQTTFAEYVQKIDSAKSIIKNQLADLQELLDSKMDEYFGE